MDLSTLNEIAGVSIETNRDADGNITSPTTVTVTVTDLAMYLRTFPRLKDGQPVLDENENPVMDSVMENYSISHQRILSNQEEIDLWNSGDDGQRAIILEIASTALNTLQPRIIADQKAQERAKNPEVAPKVEKMEPPNSDHIQAIGSRKDTLKSEIDALESQLAIRKAELQRLS